MIQQPTSSKQMKLKIDCFLKMKVYSNDFSRWTLTKRVTEKRKVGVKEFFANLLFSDKISLPASLALSPHLPLCLALLFTQSLKWPHTHTYTQTHSPVQCCQQSPLTVYHGCGNSSSVMYEKNASKNKHETLDAAYTSSTSTVQDSFWSHCRALAAAKASHKMPLLYLWIVRNNNRCN